MAALARLPWGRILASLVLCAAFLGAAMAGVQKLASMRPENEKKEGERLPELVRTRVATRADHREVVRAYGRARALRRTTQSAEVPGRIEHLDRRLEVGAAFTLPAPEPGAPRDPDAPRVGPVVVELDDRDLKDQRARIESDLATNDAERERLETVHASLDQRIALAQSELETSRRELRRIEDLVARKKLAPSQADQQSLQVTLRERAILELQSQQAENVAARKVLVAQRATRTHDLALKDREIARAKVHLPISGFVEARHVSTGDEVGKGAPLFTIVDLSVVEIPLQLPARAFGDVVAGSAIRLYDVESGRRLPGEVVSRVAPRIDDRQRVFEVYVDVAGTATSNPVAPGTFVRAAVDGHLAKDVVAVPREAFVGTDVYVVTDAPAPEGPEAEAARARGERFVVAERRTPEVVRWLVDVAIVERGLEAGESFVVSNLESVAHGALLRVAAALAEEAAPPEAR